MKALWSFTNFPIEERDIYIWTNKSWLRFANVPVTSRTFLQEIHQKRSRCFSFFFILPRFPAKTLGFVLFVKFLSREPGATSPDGNDVNDTHLNACWTGSAGKRMPRPLDPPASKRNENVYCDERGIYLAMLLLFVFLKILKILLT